MRKVHRREERAGDWAAVGILGRPRDIKRSEGTEMVRKDEWMGEV